MSERLQHVSVQTRRLSPAEAEVWIVPEIEASTPTTEIRGRFVGPRCAYANTVEIAHPLLPLSQSPEGVPPLARRVVIPEPSLWDPQSPFLYRVVVELWEEGALCERRELVHGLRLPGLGQRGLLWNGRHLALRGTDRLPSSAADITLLREEGYNLLQAPRETGWWTLGDQAGFLMLGRLHAEPKEVEGAIPLSRHACALGWVFGPEALGAGPEFAESLRPLVEQQQWLGVELDAVPVGGVPEWASFLVCPDSSVEAMTALDLPKLLVQRGVPRSHDLEATSALRVLGLLHADGSSESPLP